MKGTQLKQFKYAINAQRTVAIRDLGENREINAVERSPDEMDQTGRSAEQEFAILGFNRRSEVLRNIEAALDRIQDGTFGICSNCEELIGQNRLMAVPWTPYCIRCQEAVDRSDARNIGPSYERDINAA